MDVLVVLALPIFPGRHQPSIVGRSELNFRVRDGNGWTLALISTNFYCSGIASVANSMNFISEHRRFVNVLYVVHLQGLEPWTP